MKNKKLILLAMLLTLQAPLMACGNNTAGEKKLETPTKKEIKEVEKTGDLAVEPEPANELRNKDSGEKGIYDLEFGYLPENFVENFRNEKYDLRTAEYKADKNPAKKITIQITQKDKRLNEIIKVPEDAEDITIEKNTGKYWDDGSFNYIVIKDGKNYIYTRSTLDKQEAIKVIEEIK